MILVDTSVWIDHLRRKDHQLTQLLNNEKVTMHPFVLGEIACGNLSNRQMILSLLNHLEGVIETSHQEVNSLIENKQLMGKGIGYIDAHLLASSLLNPSTQLWTRDKRLKQCAIQLAISYTGEH